MFESVRIGLLSHGITTSVKQLRLDLCDTFLEIYDSKHSHNTPLIESVMGKFDALNLLPQSPHNRQVIKDAILEDRSHHHTLFDFCIPVFCLVCPSSHKCIA